MVACTVGDVPLLARLPGRVVLPDGDAVRLATDAPIHLFDAASGQSQSSTCRGTRRQSAHDHATRRRLLLAAGAALALPARRARARSATEISFYFPVAVGGPITKIIDGYAADFQRENPAIKVTPIYAGTYQDTLTKAQTATEGEGRAADGGAAVDRCVFADRRRPDRAVRHAGEQRRGSRPGCAASIRRS